MGQLSDPFQQGEQDELGITISGLPGEPDDLGMVSDDDPTDGGPPGDSTREDGTADDGTPTDAGARRTGEPGGDEGDGDEIDYDLGDWSEIERQAVADRLRAAGVPHGWDGATLMIAAVDEGVVENVLDIVEGEADQPLDGDRDQVAYDLSEWEDDQVTALARALRAEGLAYAWDADELFVYADDEQAVDELFDRVAHPHQLAAEADDGPAGAELLGEIFVAADRLRRDGEDNDGAASMLDLGGALDADAPPYGMGGPEWSHLCDRVRDLGDLLRADELDEDAVMASARDLRTALRPFV